MPAETTDLDTLLSDWHALAAGDRKAILRRLPIEHRLEFQRLLATQKAETNRTVAQSKHYQGYSPWLAKLLEASETGLPESLPLKTRVRVALLRGHERVAEAAVHNESAHAQSPQDTVVTLIRRLRRLV